MKMPSSYFLYHMKKYVFYCVKYKNRILEIDDIFVVNRSKVKSINIVDTSAEYIRTLLSLYITHISEQK